MGSSGQPPLSLVDASGPVRDGRYKRPLSAPRFEGLSRIERSRVKRWLYLSALCGDHWVAGAVVDLGFAAHMFAYVVSIQDGHADEMEALAPLHAVKKAARFGSSSVNGRVQWLDRRAEFAVDCASNGWTLTMDVPLKRASLKGTVRLNRPSGGEAVCLVHQWPSGDVAYTHKETGLAGEASLRYGQRDIKGPLIGGVDWTVGRMPRRTRWRWASTAWTDAQGRRLGLNLSSHIYEDDAGHGRENALWIDGRSWSLRGVHFEVPNDPSREAWSITGREPGQELQLSFTPQGARQERLYLGLIESEFCQPYGWFEGHVEVDGQRITLRDVYGVVEDHSSLW